MNQYGKAPGAVALNHVNSTTTGGSYAQALKPVSWTRRKEIFLAALDEAHRLFTLGEIIVAAIQAAGAIARRAHARHRQRRQARAIYNALQQLDGRTLHDLGFDRSEIRSVAAEVTSEAEYTRVRALPTSHSLPK